MMVLPLSTTRVSNLTQGSVATVNIDNMQAQLTQIEQELSTGKAVNVASDNPSAAAMIQQLQKTLDYNTQYATNINQAGSGLKQTDATLGNITTLLTQAQSIASANVSNTVSAESRKQAASVVDSIYNQILTIANSQYQGTYLFGTSNATSAPYNQSGSGVEFVGSTKTLVNTFQQGTDLGFQVDPTQVFGGESPSISAGTNLSPDVQPTDRIIDLAGAVGKGVSMGSVQIGNGTIAATVDLSHANSMNDVVSDINNAGLAGVTATLTQYGLQLNASGGAQISVNEVGGGSTALDLGILQQTAGAVDVPLTGANLGSKVTDFTPLANLVGGAGIDPTGFNLSNGSVTATLSLTGLTTVQDLINKLNTSNTGVRAQINAAGTGIDLVNATQGNSISISENGGTTAGQLGFRTFSPNTVLSALNGGSGVSLPAGNQFSMTTADATVISIGLTNAVTIQDVINQINTAGAGKVVASFATTGNGIVLTDTTTGAGKLSVASLNGATTAVDLGLAGNSAGGVITGSDVNPIGVAGIFSDLKKLSNALKGNDTAGITLSAQGLQTDSQNVTQANASVGSRLQELNNRSADLSGQTLANQTLLSKFQDVDYTTAVTQFQTLQTGLQASLQVSAKTLNLSLLNYIG